VATKTHSFIAVVAAAGAGRQATRRQMSLWALFQSLERRMAVHRGMRNALIPLRSILMLTMHSALSASSAHGSGLRLRGGVHLGMGEYGEIEADAVQRLKEKNLAPT